MLSCRQLRLTSMLSLVTVCMIYAGIPKPKSGGSIELISLTPEAGSSVDRESVITAQLRFTIDNFKRKKDRYQVSINFQNRDSRAATFSTAQCQVLRQSAGARRQESSSCKRRSDSSVATSIQRLTSARIRAKLRSCRLMVATWWLRTNRVPLRPFLV